MIRIRRGDFNYSEQEIEAMVEDVELFKKNGADGIVFGFLNSERQIDVEKCRKIRNAWGSSPMTFHRAFDETLKEDLEKNVEILVNLGFGRILSSGYEPTAVEGIESLKKMTKHSAGRISIMPGSGINKDNVVKIINETGCSEIHASARSELKSSRNNSLSMGGGSEDSKPLMICDPEKVAELVKISNSLQ